MNPEIVGMIGTGMGFAFSALQLAGYASASTFARRYNSCEDIPTETTLLSPTEAKQKYRGRFRERNGAFSYYATALGRELALSRI